MKDNQMERSLSQALYKYLPENWIDFYQKDERKTVVSKVICWNSTKLEDKDINVNRLLRRVENYLVDFENNGGKLKNFFIPVNAENYDVLTPKLGINADIFAETNPLTYFCSNCFKAYTFRNARAKRKNCECGGTLKQLSMIYSCHCGWAGPVETIRCREHGYKSIYYVPDSYKFFCSKDRKEFEIKRYCPGCKTLLFPKNALDQSHYIPHTFTMIDLVGKLDQDFVEEHEGRLLVLAFWLGLINENTLNRFMKEWLTKDANQEVVEEKFAKLKQKFLEMGMDPNMAEKAARASLEQDDVRGEVSKVIEEMELSYGCPGEKNAYLTAISVLEFNEIKRSKERVTLEQVRDFGLKLNALANVDEYEKVAHKYGFTDISVSGSIPFIFCSYGYSRRYQSPKERPGLALVSFPMEGKKKNVYAAKLSTEGILFEMNRKKILLWLLKNNIVDSRVHNVPDDLDDERALKAWFFNNVDLSKVNKYSNIDPENKVTYYVYRLLHSVSHALLKQAAYLCGLDKNSLSEYLFPTLASFLIYCQNSQGFSLGALFNLFGAHLDQWLETTAEVIQKCIFDPICMENTKACAGCLYLNDISCQHFNKDLDRTLLIGYYNKATKKKFYGFWEDWC